MVQQSCNRCSIVGATAYGQSFPPTRNSRCHLLSLEVCSNLPNYKWANNIIDNVAPPFTKQVNSLDSSRGVRPLRMSNPASQHRSRSSWPQPPTLASWFCRLATVLGCLVSASSGAYNSSQRSLMSMVFGRVVVHTLKSPPNNIMPPRVWTSTISAARFWNKDLFSCLEPIGAAYTT